jgi:hypothetical protein
MKRALYYVALWVAFVVVSRILLLCLSFVVSVLWSVLT